MDDEEYAEHAGDDDDGDDDGDDDDGDAIDFKVESNPYTAIMGSSRSQHW